MNLRPLPKELQQIAENELNEDQDRLKDDLEHIKDWLQKQPHLKARTDDQWLVSFLRGCKFSLEKTKEKLDCFYTMRTLVPELFANRDPFLPEIQEILNAGVVVPFPKTNGKPGPRIVMIYYRNFNPDTMPLLNLMKVYFMVCDIMMLEDDDCVVSGICFWPDMYEVPLSHVVQFTPTTIKHFVMSFQNSYPMRIKGFFCTSVAPMFEASYKMFKSMFNEKLRDRVHMFGEKNFDKICDLIPKEFHPNDIGGECGYVKDIAMFWKKKVESYKEWYMEDKLYGSDETKRVGTSKLNDGAFGVEGSFRKLTVD